MNSLLYGGSAHCIPVGRDAVDVVAGRRMLRTLYSGEVLGIFPEGGIDECRMKSGYPGVGYLALKTGAPVIPASVTWQKPRPSTLWRSLLMPGHVTVHYGTPINFGTNPHPNDEAIRVATAFLRSSRSASTRDQCNPFAPLDRSPAV